ncbi:hypothetical protein Hypma_003414 [Hypsizygus marmoreus]|uniref:Uncharacterized protein n=1 Tax=Hypsizygus marmoreus TaxID=39966 RepID=A0A369J4K9_HYPMA|nr:hypothetical protein Hypma_003414 [Hypsizygus marmoreus]
MQRALASRAGSAPDDPRCTRSSGRGRVQIIAAAQTASQERVIRTGVTNHARWKWDPESPIQRPPVTSLVTRPSLPQSRVIQPDRSEEVLLRLLPRTNSSFTISSSFASLFRPSPSTFLAPPSTTLPLLSLSPSQPSPFASLPSQHDIAASLNLTGLADRLAIAAAESGNFLDRRRLRPLARAGMTMWLFAGVSDTTAVPCK